MDFAFGTLSTDALKLYHHRLMRQGVHHGYRISPRKPAAHDPITLTVTTGSEIEIASLYCYYTTDGSEPVGGRGTVQNGSMIPLTVVDTVWDSFIWGYTTRWKGTLPGFPKGTRLRYRIGGVTSAGEECFADYPDLKMSAEMSAHRHFSLGQPPDASMRWGDPAPGTVFTLNIDQPGPPDWAKDAAIYHLMVDRFNPGPGRDWIQTTDLEGFCGGTLYGVHEKLDYIADLGFNTLWMNPIWTSPSSHGYDTADFREVQAQYGDKEILRKLIDKAHDRGLRVMFDMACNHISNEHPIFQEALNDSRSPYRDWFTFDDSELGYRGFFGVESMPEINLVRPDARDWMIEHALYWIREFDIDGYRLDYAQGARPDFWSFFVDACKSEKPDTYFFGEIIDTPDMLLPYIGRLDGSLDFHINHALRRTYGWNNWTEADFQRFLGQHGRMMPADFIMPAFLDNHDMDRFAFISGGDQDALLNGLKALFALPNPPVMLYGTEIGLSQAHPEKESTLSVIREPMRWDDPQDQALLEQTREIFRARQTAGGTS